MAISNQTIKFINTNRFSADLRRRGVDLAARKLLITNFEGSNQAKDLTIPSNCGGFGRIHHFRRFQPYPWPENPLPIDPAAKALNLQASDTLRVQVFQNAICSWRCWYCFVDFDLLSANPKFSAYQSADELLERYLSEDERPQVIDLSGGQPDLVPEWGVWFLDALIERGLDRRVYLWSDDNLSNDYLWRFLTSSEIDRLAGHSHYGRVGCFKGFDESSFAFNTQAEPKLFYQQFDLMRRVVDAGFDVYGYVTFTAVENDGLFEKMKRFVDMLQEKVHPNFPLRTVPLQIRSFTPTTERLTADHSRALMVQDEAVLAWSEELQLRFGPQAGKTITEHSLTR